MLLKLSCPDQPGTVARISGFIAEYGGNLLEMQQFTDVLASWFFMRAEIDTSDLTVSAETFRSGFAALGESLGADWHFRDEGHQVPTAILVSKEGHTLRDLIARAAISEIPIDVRAVISNHEDLRPIAEAAGFDFHHLPVRKATRADDDAAYQKLLADLEIDLVVLARFMQIIPPALCEAYAGRMINIHHSFLPAFIGANPYRQAYERGVKLIGATSHYVTAELDAGPIIEQVVERAEHHHRAADLKRLGRDCECLALSRAVRFHASDRVLLHGNRTVVFRD